MSVETASAPGDQHKAAPPFEDILFPRNPIHEHAGRLARFLAHLRYEDVPSDVLHTAKLVTLDTIGCIVAGTSTPLGEKILAVYGGPEQKLCSVPGTALRLAPSLAAKVNGWLSDVLDYEDTAAGHPSATVVPAALAMAEHLNATPKQFLTGLVAGYEAGLRLHDATRASPEAYRRFASYHAWHGVAAGAAAMVVSGGSEEQFRSAIGHAAANTNIPLWYVQYGRPAHALKANYGQMSLGGVDAALCARQNIIGPFAMLSDPERGFAAIIGSDRFDPTQLSAGLSEVWRLRETCFKGYPACYALHSTIHAVSTLVKTHNIHPDQIDKVLIGCCRKVFDWFSIKALASDLDGQFSVEYVATMALFSVQAGRDWYSPSQMANVDVCNLMRKIDVEVDPFAEEAYWKSSLISSSVTIFTKDGRSLYTKVDRPPGHFRIPFDDSDIEKKFLHNLCGTMLEARGAEIIEKTMNMDRSISLNDLCGALRTPRS